MTESTDGAEVTYSTSRTLAGGLAVRFTCPECGDQKKANALADAGDHYRCECGAEMIVPGRKEAEQFEIDRATRREKKQKQTDRAQVREPAQATGKSTLDSSEGSGLTKFRILGANRETGKDIEVVVDATDYREAEAEAVAMGILVAKVGEAHESQAVIARVIDPPQRTNQFVAATATPPVRIEATVATVPKRSNSVGLASLILGILAFLICWIPFVSVLALPLVAIGLLLALIGFVLAIARGGHGIGFPIAGGLVCGLAGVVAMITGVAMFSAVGEAFDSEAARTRALATSKPIAFGESFTTPEFQVSVKEARVDKARVEDIVGDIRVGEAPALLVVLRVVNTHDRKILRYREDNPFLPGHYQLHDDVDNAIRGVSYGFGSTPIGSLTSDDDILPGEEVSHLKVFSVPPPKTKHLVLTVNLAALGVDRTARFMIPAEAIEDFP